MNQFKPTPTNGVLGDSFLDLLVKAENLGDRMSSLMQLSTTLPTTLEELEKLIELSNRAANKITKQTNIRNVVVFDREIKNAKNYIPETDFFFV